MAAARKGSITGLEIFNQPVQVFEYIPATRENKSQGTFNFQIMSMARVLKLIISKQGAHSLIDLQITNKLKWNLQKDVYGYFLDERKQMIAQFADVATANMATAQIGLYLSCTSIKQLSFYDAFQKPGPELSEGDIVKISYSAYPLDNFPKIGNLLNSVDGDKATLSPDEMPVGLFNGIKGMSTGSTRVIFVPENMLATSSGSKESWIPSKPVVYIVQILNSKFKDESKRPSHAVAQESPSRREAPAEKESDDEEPAAQPQENEKSENDDENEGGDNASDVPESSGTDTNADEPEPAANSFAAKIAKFKKIGHASPFVHAGIPLILAKKKQKEEEERQRQEEERMRQEESESTDTPKEDVTQREEKTSSAAQKQPEPVEEPKQVISERSKPPAIPERKRVIEEAIEDNSSPANDDAVKEVEQSIKSHLSKLTDAKLESPDAIARSVATMVAQLKVADSELESLTKQVEMARQKSSTSNESQRLYNEALAETQRYKRRLNENENIMKGLEEKYSKAVAGGSSAKGEKAKSNMINIIKQLTQSTFTGMNDEFVEGKTYEGQEIIDALLVLLKKQAYTAIGMIDESGLC